MSEERKQAEEPRILRVDGANRGIAYGGRNFHLRDFVLFKAQQGPANIGYIMKVSTDNVRVKRAGRIGSLENILPDDVMRDEVCFPDMILFIRSFLTICVASCVSHRRGNDGGY